MILVEQIGLHQECCTLLWISQRSGRVSALSHGDATMDHALEDGGQQAQRGQQPSARLQLPALGDLSVQSQGPHRRGNSDKGRRTGRVDTEA